MQIDSERLVIRDWTPADRAPLERMVADPDMMRYITRGRIWRSDEVDELLERQRRHLTTHGCCIGVLSLKDDGAVVGIAGIQPLDAPGAYELAWWVWKDYWGRGYATEIAQALVAHARDDMGLKRIYAVIDPPNIASVRIAEKIGMRLERVTSARETVARREDVEVALYVLTL